MAAELDPLTAGIVRDLARRVLDHEDRIRSLARGSQARHRSVEGGAQVLYDEADELRAVVGELEDGSYGITTYGGGAPPVPSVPLITPVPGGVTITWDGFDANDEQGWPDNFARVRVHQSTIPGDPPDTENTVGSFESPAGGALTIAHPPDVTTYVYLVAVSTSGVESAPSVEVEATGGVVEVDLSTVDPAELGSAVDLTDSPDLTVTGFSEGLIVRASDVAPGATIEYHISTEDGFIPDATTLAADTRATVYVLNMLPDGTLPDPDTTYYLKSVAHNLAGPAPAPSAQAIGRLDLTAASTLIAAELVAGFILTGRIQIGVAYIDAALGIVIPQPDGGVIHFPVDGSAASVTADLIAKSLTIDGNGWLYGLMQVSGTVQLTAGVTDPTEPPTILPSWPTLPCLLDPLDTHHGLSETPDATKWVTASSRTHSMGGKGLTYVDKATGAITGEAAWPGSLALGFDLLDSFDPLGGVTRIGAGTSFYSLVRCRNAGSGTPVFEWWVLISNAAGLLINQWKTPFGDDDIHQTPAIGNDGTNLLLAWVVDSDVKVRTFTSLGVPGATVTCPMGSARNLAFVGRGTYDYGVTRIVVAQQAGDVQTFSVAGTPSAFGFPRAAGASARGMRFDGTRFVSLDKDAQLRQHSVRVAADTVTAQYSWRDDDATGGTHDTLPSPAAVEVVPARAWPSIEAKPAPDVGKAGPDIADRVRIYAKETGGVVGLQGATLPAGDRVMELDSVVAGAAPPAANDFDIQGGGGQLAASLGGFFVNGASNGAIGAGTLRDSVQDAVGLGVTPQRFGAVGDGVADDTAAVQDAIDAVVAAGGGTVYFPAGVYKITADLTADASNVGLVGAGWKSVLSYTGAGVALTLGSKTSGAAVNGLRVENLRITGTAAGQVAIRAVGVQFSRFAGLRIDGFSGAGAIGLLFDTQSVGAFAASINNTVLGGFITGCYHGVKLTKDAADTGTDGCNHNSFYGLRVAVFSGIGIDIDWGENNSLFGVDSSSSNDGTTGIRVNDDVTGLYQVRTDNSFGPPNTAIGIRITATGRDHLIFNPTGDGANTRIQYDDTTVSGMVFRDGFHSWVGNVRRNRAATGSDKWVARAWKNISASTIGVGEVGFFDSTCGEGEVKRHAFAAASANPLVAVESILTTASGGFAEPGSVLNLACDAGAVAVGDTMVVSTTVNGRAKADNTVTAPRNVIGTARTSKAAGANGTVKVYVR